jgi:glucose dehydrogenase
MTTAGNLVFHGDWEGWFKAVNATTGEVLWKFNVGSGVGAGPMTYKLDGVQYVAVVVGRSSTIPAFLGAVEADLGVVKLHGGPVGQAMAAATPEAGMLFVFSR